MRTLDDLLAEGVSGRRVFLRADLNVPLDKTTRAITDDGRIRASLPTLQALRDAGARVVVAAHLGRPKGTPDPQFSLAPVAARLGELLGTTVPLGTRNSQAGSKFVSTWNCSWFFQPSRSRLRVTS